MTKLDKMKNAYSAMDEKVYAIADKGLEEIAKVILRSPNEDIFDEVLDIFYNMFTEIYTVYLQELRNIYHRIVDFEVEEIMNLLYTEDGKTPADRIQQYLVDGKDNALYIIAKIYNLVFNEIKVMKRAIITRRIQPIASILFIECNEGDCRFGCSEYAGEYPADEPIELPPYHPNCSCTYYFIETDEDDDIVDLDLEVDEARID